MGKIKNFSDLAITPLREAALQILEAGYEAIDTREVVRRHVRFEENILHVGGETIDLSSVRNVIVCGAGKCSPDAVVALEEIFGDRIKGGVVIGTHPIETKYVKMISGTHPFPSEENIEATKELLQSLENLTENDLVLMVISGGGSTLLSSPSKGMTFEDEVSLVKILFSRGATIRQLNTIRKHLSNVRGGGLAVHAYPAKVVSLIFSDVPGNDMTIVASGPTIRDESTVADAEKVVRKFDEDGTLLKNLSFLETEKDEKYFVRVKNILLASNTQALEAMKQKAHEMGYFASIMTDTLEGEAKDLGIRIVDELHGAPLKSVHLYGGEPTVTTTRPGRGGRELELVLSALSKIEPRELVIGAASDGRDNTDYAGALCDIMTLKNAHEKGLDPVVHIYENSSYKFFEQVGDFLLTEETGSNVSDLIVAIKV